VGRGGIDTQAAVFSKTILARTPEFQELNLRKVYSMNQKKGLVRLFLVMVVLSCMVFPLKAKADFIRDAGPGIEGAPDTDTQALKMELENRLIRERLEEVGVTPAEALGRINLMTPGERASVVDMLETIQAGGSPQSAWWTLCLVILVIALAA
jgi:hypothetical protein